MRRAAMTPDYFIELYARDPDPWGFATRQYEHAKYAATLAALPAGRFESALEIGCSIGVLTAMLAPRCGALSAIDPVDSALAAATARCAAHAQVRFARMTVPQEWPAGAFDLVLLSEVVYYLTRDEIATLVARVRASLRPHGAALLVHWTGETDYPLSGDEAATCFIAEGADFLDVTRQDRTPHYRLDVLARR